ncbi:MAG TPA: restriction endonuclease [Thermoanaerobaculia bacterium]|nr:restriction endonuclease [Thermoanaerobaculia bacterium]
MSSEPPWREYERAVHEELRSKYPGVDVRFDVTIAGRRSRVDRQVDVLVLEQLHGTDVLTAVDAKHYGRRIDVTHVEAFLGLLDDISVDRGMMVSPNGYTPAALDRAFRDDVDLDLEILSLAELQVWQAEGAIPYAGRNAVLLPSPFGWIIDGQRRSGMLARLYRRGLPFEEAAEMREWMYVNLWDRTGAVDSLEALLAKQSADIHESSPEAIIHVDDIQNDGGRRICIRTADIPGYPATEITGFAEFANSIFFAVLFTPPAVERRNRRKLEYLLRKVQPIHVRTAA